MRTAVLLFCLCLVSNSAYSQTRSPTEPPVFDKKLWTTTGIMVGSSILMTEIAVRKDQQNQSERRLKIYTAAGISDFLVFALSANLKSNGKKLWWVLPIALSAINGRFAVKYSKNF